jgi:hypothetical protein
VRSLPKLALAFALLLGGLVPLLGCDNALTGNIVPVPAVHRMPIEVEGTTLLLADDPVIESKDPVHLARAKEARVPQDYGAAMSNAFSLAGFRVVTERGQTHDLAAKLALAVREEGGKVYQTYRCGLMAPDGSLVAQIDWAWPQGTYVAEDEVYAYATHSLANEIALSPKVIAYLRSHRGGGRDAGAAPAP